LRWAWRSSLEPIAQRLWEHCRELEISADRSLIDIEQSYGVDRVRPRSRRSGAWWQDR
jgi:hypothetical protein